MSTALATHSSEIDTTGAVAAVVGFSRRTVLEWYKSGKISGTVVHSRLTLVNVADAKQQAERIRSGQKTSPPLSA